MSSAALGARRPLPAKVIRESGQRSSLRERLRLAPRVGALPPEVPLVCALHKRHWPSHLTTEFHHVVPVAWQLMWQPALPWPFPGRDPDGRGQLWDDRGLLICPTGHRNVHAWIVLLMHAARSEDPAQAIELVRSERAAARGIEFETATMALTRWKEGGGELQALVHAGEWGES